MQVVDNQAILVILFRVVSLFLETEYTGGFLAYWRKFYNAGSWWSCFSVWFFALFPFSGSKYTGGTLLTFLHWTQDLNCFASSGVRCSLFEPSGPRIWMSGDQYVTEQWFSYFNRLASSRARFLLFELSGPRKWISGDYRVTERWFSYFNCSASIRAWFSLFERFSLFEPCEVMWLSRGKAVIATFSIFCQQSCQIFAILALRIIITFWVDVYYLSHERIITFVSTYLHWSWTVRSTF